MTKRIDNILFLIITTMIISCTSPRYIHDVSSNERQKELRQNRSGNIFSDIGIGIVSVFSSAAFELDVSLYPAEQQFKKMNLVNPTRDTMYVNMLTDLYWDKENYCDFMDIRIPPDSKCKILVPINANYNLYYSTTPESDDDSLMQIFTTDVRRIVLDPELMVPLDTSEETF